MIIIKQVAIYRQLILINFYAQDKPHIQLIFIGIQRFFLLLLHYYDYSTVIRRKKNQSLHEIEMGRLWDMYTRKRDDAFTRKGLKNVGLSFILIEICSIKMTLNILIKCNAQKYQSFFFIVISCFCIVFHICFTCKYARRSHMAYQNKKKKRTYKYAQNDKKR